MKRLPLKEIMQVIGGEVLHGDPNPMIDDVVIRQEHIAIPNTLFFHRRSWEHLDWVFVRKQKNVVVFLENLIDTTPKEWGNATIVKVPDIQVAYWGFVNYYRSLFQLPVFAITGTCGKTSVKEMLKHIFTQDYRVTATHRSRNAARSNLPYMLSITDETQVAVFETGVAYPRDLLESAKYFQPNIGIILNIGVDHVDSCKTFDNYLKGKSYMLPALKYQGTLILNADDENIAKINLSKYKGRILYVGVGEKADFRATDIRYGQGGMEFTLEYYHLKHRMFVPSYGEHYVYNALAAIAGAHTAGLGIREIGERLKTFQNIEGHMQAYEGVRGSTVIDDSWRNNPQSVQAALYTLGQLANGRKTVALLSSMTELLGDAAHAEHEKVGRLVVDNRVDLLITLGEFGKVIAKSAIQAGMGPKQVIICDDKEQVIRSLGTKIDDALILLKMKYSEHILVHLIDRKSI